MEYLQFYLVWRIIVLRIITTRHIKMVEYSKDNRFPFRNGDKSVSVCFDDHEEKYELDFIWNRIVERFPQMDAEPFYARVHEIQNMKSGDTVKYLKDACDKLLRNIKTCLSDEPFIHELHDKWGFGLD